MRSTFCLLLLCLLALPALAYDNDGRDANGNGLIKGGPHRTINELAVQRWLQECPDTLVKRYQALDDYSMLGPTVVEPGLEIVTTEDRAGNLRWWVAEGGYDADEPELYNSFRHFYDPRSLDGVPYLTDHLSTLDYVYRAFIFTSKVGHVVGFVAGHTVNPQVNARDWALTGEKNNGWGPNDYCWDKGREYMKAAFAETDAAKKQKLFAQAWRALGETMHLIGDMTCVPHVRNDSHPGKAIGYKGIGNTDPNIGYLKNDPYELMTTEPVIREQRNAALDPQAKSTVDEAEDPKTLFYNVAMYTQEHFFSADTIGGSYTKDRGTPAQHVVKVTPANGKKTYPFPVLKACDFDEKTGYFTREINGKPIKLCHEDWMSSIGWGDPQKNGPQISRECVVEQASVLIPLAIYANMKLVDWYVPRLELAITNIDPTTKAVTATLTHKTYGAHTTALSYTQSYGQVYRLWVNGAQQPHAAFTFNTVNNNLTGTLNLPNLKKGDKVTIGLGVGGLLVKSTDYIMGEGAKPGDGCWVLDAVVTDPHHSESKDKLALDTRDSTVGEGGGSTRYHHVFTGINKFDYTIAYTHGWTTPPRSLTPGKELTLTVSVAENGCVATGDEQFWHDRWGDTNGAAILQISREIIERAKKNGYPVSDYRTHALGDAKASAWYDSYRPKEGVSRANKAFTFEIPTHSENNQELAIMFNIDCNNVGGGIVFYYKWNGPAIPEIPYTGGCVALGTQVTLADGSHRPIEQIKPGDRIAAFDQTTGLPAPATVERLLIHTDGPFATQHLQLQSGQTLQVTGNHPIFTTRGAWTPVAQLTPGAGVYVYDPATRQVQPTTVLAIIRDWGTLGTVYNLKTSLGDYYANDVLIHNKCLAAGSLIDTPHGPCPVERLRVGQQIYGCIKGQRVRTTVTHLYAKSTIRATLPGKRLTPHVAATVNHRIWHDGAFHATGELPYPAVAIRGAVYDVQTRAGNYYADGLLMTASE